MSTLEMIHAAAKRGEGKIQRTPLLHSDFLDEIAGRRLLVKAECLQTTGSFKFRGGWSAVSALEEATRARGVIAYSSGNHAQGVAMAAKILGAPAVIIMPKDAPELKLANTRAMGAEVVLYDRYSEDRDQVGNEIAEARGLHLIKPYDNEYVIAGQGTCGLEIAEQAAEAGVASGEVLVCCGGGGLTSGVALACSENAPGLKVRPVEPENYDDVARSLASGRRESIDGRPPSICDAIVTPSPGEITFPILSAHCGAGIVVNETEVLNAMRLAFNRLKIVVEPGGAVALAAALFHSDKIESDAVIAVATGGNVDSEMFAKALATEGQQP